MGSASKIETNKTDKIDATLASEKHYIRVSGNAFISRSYFKETRSSIEKTEIESKGLYCFEKLVRIAFVQAMRDDFVLGNQGGFIAYMTSLSDSFETSEIKGWKPKDSADRLFDFMASFYNLYAYRWKMHGRTPEKTLFRFLEITRECLDFGYIKLSERFDLLPKDVKAVVNKSFSLANKKIDGWYEERSLEISAA